MLLFPKKTKFSKSFSGKKISANRQNNFNLNKYGNIALVAEESGKVTNFQLESTRRFLRRFLKKKAQIFYRIFPNIPITKKPNDVRLGRGKGNIKYWSSFVKKGTILLEIRCFDDSFANKILNGSRIKLSTKTFSLNRQTRWIL